MRQDDFFTETAEDGWSGPELKHDLLQEVTRGPLLGESDIDVAYALVNLAHKELEAYGTSGNGRVNDDDDMQLLLRASATACLRAGVEFPQLPFRNLSTFRNYWNSAGMYGSYQARRDYLNGALGPVEEAVNRRYFVTLNDELVKPISPKDGTGWAVLDHEISQLRSRFKVARTEQDHCAVGAACVRILETLGEISFDGDVHLAKGAEMPPRDKTKVRFEAVISHALPGKENENVRKLARAVVEVSHEVKHRRTPTRRDAGIAADSVIFLANLLRRLAKEPASEMPKPDVLVDTINRVCENRLVRG